ncbi:MAG: class I SAM-dependent methyltransferase [Flavisolibacter sp.]
MNLPSGKVIEFYNQFITEQIKSGINDRIYHLFKRLLALGLNSHSNVLELGSGIGAMTVLLSKKLREGRVEAVDLSPQSIEFSRQRIKSPNVSFVVADVVNYKPSIQQIDFVTLFDILEHVPVDQHPDLFQNIASVANDQTRILINIPNPAYIEYDMINHPQSLQIIDQALLLSTLLKNLDKNGLTLSYFETYSIWVENDYQFMVIEKRKEFKEIDLNSKRNFFQKILKKLARTYVRLRHKYP